MFSSLLLVTSALLRAPRNPAFNTAEYCWTLYHMSPSWSSVVEPFSGVLGAVAATSPTTCMVAGGTNGN